MSTTRKTRSDQREFDDAVDRVVAMFDTLEQNTLPARYDLGAACGALQQNSRYGDSAVLAISRRLGRSESGIRKFIRITHVWTKAEFMAITRKRNTAGRPLSWTHFELIAVVRTKRNRKILLQQTLKHSWSVNRTKQGRNALQPKALRQQAPAPHADLLRKQLFNTFSPGLRKNASATARKITLEGLETLLARASDDALLAISELDSVSRVLLHAA